MQENAYAGLLHEGERVFRPGALKEGGFEVIVSGHRGGTGSSRETAPQCERWSGIRIVIAASFAPYYERNNINLGQVNGNHAMLERLQDGEIVPLSEFTERYDPVTSSSWKMEDSAIRKKLEGGGCDFAKVTNQGKTNDHGGKNHI